MFGSITGQKNIEKDTIFIAHTRPARLLNVLYTFNLGPVSTEKHLRWDIFRKWK